MRLFHRPIIYARVYQDHFLARGVGESRTIRRDCHSLENRQGELKDFTRIRETLRELFRELAPDFSLRKPVGLMHFIPEHYVPTPHEVKSFKRAAERAGVFFCWISRWETPHTDEERTNVFRML